MVIKAEKMMTVAPQFKMSARPLILLDVDGVINAAGRESKYWKDAQLIERFPCEDSDGDEQDYTIYFSPSVVRKINEWSKKAEIKWLSSWNNRANKYLAPAIGLHSFECARGDASTSKLNAVLAHVHAHPDRLIIWIDDQLSSVMEKHRNHIVYQNKIFKRANTVIVSPKNGLISEHITFVDTILRNPSIVQELCITKCEEGDHKDRILDKCVIC